MCRRLFSRLTAFVLAYVWERFFFSMCAGVMRCDEVVGDQCFRSEFLIRDLRRINLGGKMVRQSIEFDGISKSGEVWQIFQPVKMTNISNISRY